MAEHVIFHGCDILVLLPLVADFVVWEEFGVRGDGCGGGGGWGCLEMADGWEEEGRAREGDGFLKEGGGDVTGCSESTHCGSKFVVSGRAWYV